MPGILWVVLTTPFMLFAFAPVEDDSERLAALGESLYQGHCGRCHGTDGDDTGYYRIVPLAGVARRPPVGLVARFRQDSFSTRGVGFSGERARALSLHLARLRGAKGFPDPGWLWSPDLLERKAALIEECRVVDVRSEEEYAEGRIPNAVSLPLDVGERGGSVPRDRVEALFQELGIGELTQVVVYDRSGGPDAARIWWTLVDAGHPYVALLDGGWEHWVALGFPMSRRTPRIEPGEYTPQVVRSRLEGEGEVGPAREIAWDWRRLTDSNGLRDAETIRSHLEGLGIDVESGGRYRVDGSLGEGALLLFIGRLFGVEGEVRREGRDGTVVTWRPSAGSNQRSAAGGRRSVFSGQRSVWPNTRQPPVSRPPRESAVGTSIGHSHGSVRFRPGPCWSVSVPCGPSPHAARQPREPSPRGFAAE